jgi:hypothetical protein
MNGTRVILSRADDERSPVRCWFAQVCLRDLSGLVRGPSLSLGMTKH